MNIKDYNWDLWLPPDMLPWESRSGDVKRIGQIWAFSFDENNDNCVALQTSLHSWKSLSRPKFPKSSFYHPSTVLGILVADVGQEPKDPDLLYQFLYK